MTSGAKDVQSAPFRTDPKVPFVVFCHATYYLTAQSCSVFAFESVLRKDLIFGIKVVHTAEISAQPQRSLPVFDDAPDACIGQTVFPTIRNKGARLPGSRVITHQSEIGSNPYFPRIVLTKGANEVRNEQLSLPDIVDMSLIVDGPEAVVPTPYPQFSPTVFIDLGDITLGNGVREPVSGVAIDTVFTRTYPHSAARVNGQARHVLSFWQPHAGLRPPSFIKKPMDFVPFTEV